jgi:hypothetical protein
MEVSKKICAIRVWMSDAILIKALFRGVRSVSGSYLEVLLLCSYLPPLI